MRVSFNSICKFPTTVGVLDGFRDLQVESERVGNVAATLADGAVVVNDDEVEETGSPDL
jgi:hypothetical protein